MEIHQLIDTAAPGDAIMNDALALRAQLRQVTPSLIICDRSAHPGLEPEIVPTAAFARSRRTSGTRSVDDVLIVHASIGNESLHQFVMSRPERLLIRYHNITPSSYFRAQNPFFADLLDLGREHLAELVERSIGAVAASAFNAAELVDLGMPADRVRVVPPLFPYDGFAAGARQGPRSWATPYDGTAGGCGPRILFVGQALPHKRADLLVEAYHVLLTHLDPRARLRVIGPVRNEGYATAVYQLADDLRVPIDFAGSVSQPVLEQAYREAHVLVTMSEHEGFCVPIVEAMAAGLPVVARRFGAVPETLGAGDEAGGLLLDPDDDAFVIAEAINTVCSDEDLRESLAARGRLRAERFAPAQASQRFLAALTELL